MRARAKINRENDQVREKLVRSEVRTPNAREDDTVGERWKRFLGRKHVLVRVKLAKGERCQVTIELPTIDADLVNRDNVSDQWETKPFTLPPWCFRSPSSGVHYP